MKKRVLSISLIICILISVMSVCVSAEIVDSGTCGDNLTWTLDDTGLLTISGSGAMENYADFGKKSPWYDVENKIKKVIIEKNVTTIGNYAFRFCGNLTNITIPDSVTTIGDSAFRSCVSLTNITIPDSVTTIGEETFYYCSGLTEIIIPKNVWRIGNSAFGECKSLVNIVVNTDNGSYSSDDGVLFNWNKTKLIQYPLGRENGSYIVPNSVVEIGDYAFYDCKKLTNITIPEHVERIGNFAFTLCELESITIPDSVTNIGEYAFANCDNLTSLKIKGMGTLIGKYAFSDCDKLLDIEIIHHYISEGAFSYCNSLTNVTTSYASNFAFAHCENLREVTLSNDVISIGNRSFYGCFNLENIELPDRVEIIGEAAFSGCNSLKDITIPDKVESIGNYAFSDCSSLNSVTIPNAVTDIGDAIFSGCDNLENVKIFGNVSYIDDSAFSECTGLKSIVIPDSVTVIEGYAFYECRSLRDVYYSGNEEQWKKISIREKNGYLTNATIHYNQVIPHKLAYNKREDASNEISVTLMKNKKDMSESADEYEWLKKIRIPKEQTTISESGYYDEKVNGKLLSDGDKIYLEKSGVNVPIVRGVYLGGTDVRRGKKAIKSDFTGQLTAEIDWNGQKEKIAYIDNGITQHMLTDGKTTGNIDWGNFIYNSRGTYIVLKTVNGYTTKKKLNITLSENVNVPEEIELNIFDKITGVGTGLIPYLDDLELSFDIPNFKLDFTVNPEDNTIKGVFGVDVAEWAYENDLRDKKDGKWEENDKQNAYKTITELIKDTAKEMEKNKKDKTTLAQDYKKLEKQLGKAKKKTTAKFGFDADISAVGYLEGKMDHNGMYVSDAGIIVAISAKGKLSGEGIAFVVVPYNWKLEGNASAKVNVKIAQEIREQKLKPEGSVGITIGVNGEGGPGLKKVHFNLGVAGSLSPIWQFAPESVFNLSAKLGIYVEAVAWCWTWHEDLKDWNFQLYPRPKTASLMSVESIYDKNSYSLRKRKFENIPSEFVANKSVISLLSQEVGRTDKEIMTNSYDVSTPQYVELSDGRALLVWIGDDKERSVINGTSLMYSLKDGETWSEAAYIENDGSGDYSPMLKKVGEEVYLVWEEIDVQPDDASMEESLKEMDIKCARFDAENNKFTDIIQVTDNSYMDSTPCIGLSDDGIIVSWITNSSEDPFETESTYGIDYAVIKNGEVTSSKTAVESISSIDSHIAVLNGNEADIYYIVDTDGDLATTEDNVLYENAGIVKDSVNVSGLCSYDGIIYYYKDGQISSLGENYYLTGETLKITNNNYCILNDGKTVVFTRQEEKCADIYAYFYDEMKNAWGEAVRLTNLDCKITDLSGFTDQNGIIQLAFNKKNLAEENSESTYYTSDLSVISITPSYNISLKDVYAEKSNIMQGEELDINIEVYNKGEKTVEGLLVSIYDGNGSFLSQSSLDEVLLPGEEGKYKISYLVPEDFTPTEITVEVTVPYAADYDSEDNSMKMMLDFNNLSVSGINYAKTENGYSINAVIANTGFSPEKDVEVSLLKGEETLETVRIETLASLEKKDISFNSILENEEYTVKITEKDNEEILVDNEKKITVIPRTTNTDTDGYIKELSFADGTLYAEISMFNAHEISRAYLAIYDEKGQIEGISTVPVAQNEKSFGMEIKASLLEGKTYYVKLMLWDGNYKPFIPMDVREFSI